MSLGLPAHLIPRVEQSVALHARHAVGFTVLVSAALVAVGYQAENPHAQLWQAILAPAVAAAALWLAARRVAIWSTVLALTVGGLAFAAYLAAFTVADVATTDDFTLALPAIALVMVGGPGMSAVARFLWPVVGYALAESIVLVVAVVTATTPYFNVSTALSLVALTVLQVVNTILPSPTSTVQPALHRASRDEQMAILRYRIETRAAALMHDTVLSHLAALAGATETTVSPALLAQIARDVDVLRGDGWLNDVGSEADDRAGGAWQRSPLFAAIVESREQGLEVDVTGDLTAVSHLHRAAAQALALAVKQCLVNVLRHAGTGRAEVVVYALHDEVSVMVIDAGRGFSEAETGGDRLGLRQSVRRRIESVGGNVQVWSTPGRGTSIMIHVPARSATGAPEVAS